MQFLDASSVESINSEDNDFPVGDPSLEACCDELSDRDVAEQIHRFSEGRRLLLGV